MEPQFLVAFDPIVMKPQTMALVIAPSIANSKGPVQRVDLKKHIWHTGPSRPIFVTQCKITTVA